jgi:hypothetical protein
MAQTTGEQMDTSTQAGRIHAAGGAGLPDSVIQIAHRAELKRVALASDRNISETFRREQVEALDEESHLEAQRALNAEMAAAERAVTQRKGQILSEIKAQFAPGSGALETASEQAERHHRTIRDTVGLLPDVFAAQSAEDPIDLLDALEEALRADQHARVRKLAPVIVARLVALSAEKHDGAAAALQSARRQFNAYRTAHPTLNQQLRDVEAEERDLALPNHPTRRRYQKAIDHFKLGAASKQGMRL